MNLKSPLFCTVVLISCVGVVTSVAAQDPVSSLLIQPQVILQNRQQLNLSDEQVERIHAVLEEGGLQSQESKRRADAAMGRLTELLAVDEVDEETALKQLDAVLAAEKEQRRLHLRIMLQLRKELTSAQREIAMQLQQKPQTRSGSNPPKPADTPRQLAARPRPVRPLPQGDAAVLDEFYQPDEVQSVYLRVAEEDMQRMLTALPKRIYVPASFRWRDVSIEKVAIRFKGNSSSNPTQPYKRSFLIKFDKYDDDGRFFGLRRASLDNGIQFGSLFSEPIITEILRDQGIKTHRCNYARLYLNDEYRGVYANVERVDESFMEHHLPDAKGSLFKVDEGGPGGNLQFLGEDPAAYKRAFEAKSDAAKKEAARLVEFIKMINQSAASDLAANLEAKMELDEFLRVTAVMLLSGAFDQLTGWHPHNYYLYHDGDADRWRYMPWDLDVGFSEIAFGRIHVLADWNAAWPVPGDMPNPLLERIIADPLLLQRYRQTARTILDKYFEPQRLCGIIDAKYELIRRDLQADPFPHRRVTNPGDRSYDDIVESIKGFVRKRHATALEQLENPGPRPKVVRRPRGAQANNRPPGLPPQIAGKIQRIQQRTREMQRNGEDLAPVHKVMQRVGPLLQQGKGAEAAQLLDEALKLIGDEPGKM